MEASFRELGWRRLVMLGGLLLALLGSLLLDLQAGPADLSLGQILAALWDSEQLDLRHRIILFDVRLPDALIALAVGAALGLSGLETQTVLNNPLASPYTLGVSAFAAFGAGLAIVFMPTLPGIGHTLMLPLLALLFALLCGALVLLFSRLTGGARESVVLFGMALFFLGTALTSALQYVGDTEAVDQIVFWTIGDLTKAGWPEVIAVSLCFALVLPFSLRHVWVLTLLRAGEAQAQSLGLDLNRIRLWVLLRVSVLCAFAVCFVGAIGFVGLIGPHIARILLGEDHRYLVPGAALCGALILSLASFLSKALLPGVIIPVGIITSLVGVPIFLALIVGQKRRV
ncbi:MAG: iron ABC transporter permease [Pseudomonadota bacterium]|nr:iron ABC transporter permease [Pseudomonadota bacterium]